MHNPAQAYGQTARVVSNPREHEANLLIKAAKQLQAVKEPFDPRSDKFRDAVTYNRKLWSIFASSVVGDDNPLPDQIKQNIGISAETIIHEPGSVARSEGKAKRVVDNR